ncbi:MAG: Fic family protein [Rikenellaceae bacterium]
MAKYIYEYSSWPSFSWDESLVSPLLSEVRFLQGQVLGKIQTLGFSVQEQTALNTITDDVIKSSEIEGEKLNYDQVRSFVARRLGIETAGLVESDRYVEGVVEMMLDATQNYKSPLDNERLFGWHNALFPTGRSGLYKIEVAQYRTGEMQVVTGAMGKEVVHSQAPSPEVVPSEMQQFLEWLNSNETVDKVLKSAIAHFWFIVIHPFDDGNGRIARAISDLLLTRSDDSPLRFYSLSAQILHQKKEYYAVLQKVQYSDSDITPWLVWYLECFKRALMTTETLLKKVISKAEFWECHKDLTFNHRQQQMLNLLMGDFVGVLNTSKWAKITKCSKDTALRDIQDLISKGILSKDSKGGRSVNYELK